MANPVLFSRGCNTFYKSGIREIFGESFTALETVDLFYGSRQISRAVGFDAHFQFMEKARCLFSFGNTVIEGNAEDAAVQFRIDGRYAKDSTVHHIHQWLE